VRELNPANRNATAESAEMGPSRWGAPGFEMAIALTDMVAAAYHLKGRKL
jgi:hypothetical protein